MSPEFAVIGLNICIVAVAYTSVFPVLAGKNVKKIALLDLIASVISLCIVGSVYWGNDFGFSLGLFEVNWFWYTLITYGLCEIPAYLWYVKKHRITL
ncbi:hypothetical protein DRW07_17655 [Alteromonas sediminis]|uniref:Uncharacterized protein n=1 Tax=Alteromonas sediminis TaxID=2259342 RepID=A0A3N5XXG7_9ALTE|nr:hypothetical protein [Alteromonas sediminis]RPJ65133.1 hypothetical protein DRW07_17655 [Alteromonas sediminis]